LYPVIGWQEAVEFPDWKNVRMTAKADTGAKSSAIHAEEYEVIRHPSTHERIVNEELRMKIKVGSRLRPRYVWVKAAIVDYRNVKNSGGKIEERPFIQTHIRIDAGIYPIILSVTNREKMKCPVLLGRNFMAGKFLVDPAAMHLLKSAE
jgi:hypothetical protein